MNRIRQVYHEPRDYRTIKLWENVKSDDWNSPKWQIVNSIRDVESLSQVIKLNDYQKQEIERTCSTLSRMGKEPLRITPYYASLINEDPFFPKMLDNEKSAKRLDPIFWQSVPTPAHLLFPDTGIEAAMCEEKRSYGAVYQRYPNRVALFVGENTNCASFCTHCQRTKSLDSTTNISKAEINKGIFYINYNVNIDEVLVTGGDALMIGTERLKYILEELSKIDHLRVIRIATRVPVVMPMGVTEDVLDVIKKSSNKHSGKYRKYVYFMTHVNHWQEITEDFADAIQRIHDAGFSVRNQTVFLKHVNSYLKTLAETFRRMLYVGVEPYYLLQCHKEKGLVHFIAPIQLGKVYMQNLQGWISGMAKPDYAVNVEGGGGKILLMPSTHYTMGVIDDIEESIGPSQAVVRTWDKRIYDKYEALGRARQEEFNLAVESMDKFIGRTGVFKPCLIIVDDRGNYIRTTNKIKIPQFSNRDKSMLFDYDIQINDLPITNPFEIRDNLDELYSKR